MSDSKNNDDILKHEKLFYDAKDRRVDSLQFYAPMEKLYKTFVNETIVKSIDMIIVWTLLLFYSFLI